MKVSLTSLVVLTTIVACGRDDSSPTNLPLTVLEAADGGTKGEKGDAGPAGKDGANGKDGAPGAKGDKGDAGANGTPGKDGASAPDATPNQWKDALTGLTWYIGGTSNYGGILLYSACGTWRLPTAAEGLTAALHGLGLANSSGPVDFWTATASATFPSTYGTIIKFSNSQSEERAQTEVHGVFCVK